MKLISYTGRAPVEVDLGTAEKRARAAGKPFARETRGGTLYLRPGTTATLSEDEFAALAAAVPAALRFVFVHPALSVETPAPEVPADLGAPGCGFSHSEASFPVPEGQEISSPAPEPQAESGASATTVPALVKNGKKGKR